MKNLNTKKINTNEIGNLVVREGGEVSFIGECENEYAKTFVGVYMYRGKRVVLNEEEYATYTTEKSNSIKKYNNKKIVDNLNNENELSLNII